MIKVLVIGNSFGQDSVRYLYGIARAAGKDVRVVNLYIGGCSLYRHYRNMLSEESVYDYVRLTSCHRKTQGFEDWHLSRRMKL